MFTLIFFLVHLQLTESLFKCENCEIDIHTFINHCKEPKISEFSSNSDMYCSIVHEFDRNGKMWYTKTSGLNVNVCKISFESNHEDCMGDLSKANSRLADKRCSFCCRRPADNENACNEYPIKRPGHFMCVDNSTCDIETERCTKTNDYGGNECQCKDGYTTDNGNKLNCIDIDECEEITRCDATTQDCKNNNGGYECQCKNGFKVENGDSSSCIDIDECEEITTCDVTTQNCKNNNGGYECQCKVGFKVENEDTSSCIDIDECLTTLCSNSQCKNIIGSFQCVCGKGYTKDTATSCIVCEKGKYGDGCIKDCSHNCYQAAQCNHVTGDCDPSGCRPGYEGTKCDKLLKIISTTDEIILENMKENPMTFKVPTPADNATIKPGSNVAVRIDHRQLRKGETFMISISHNGMWIHRCTCDSPASITKLGSLDHSRICRVYLPGINKSYKISTYIYNKDVAHTPTNLAEIVTITVHTRKIWSENACLTSEKMFVTSDRERKAKKLDVFEPTTMAGESSKFFTRTKDDCPMTKNRKTEIYIERINQDMMESAGIIPICIVENLVKKIDIDKYLNELIYLPLPVYTHTDRLDINLGLLPSGPLMICMDYTLLRDAPERHGATVCGLVDVDSKISRPYLIGRLTPSLSPPGLPVQFTWPLSKPLTISAKKIFLLWESSSSGYIGKQTLKFTWRMSPNNNCRYKIDGPDLFITNCVNSKTDVRVELLTTRPRISSDIETVTIIDVTFEHQLSVHSGLFIVCVLNCHDVLNPHTPLFVKADCGYGCHLHNSDLYRITWTVTQHDSLKSSSVNTFVYQNHSIYLSFTPTSKFIKFQCTVFEISTQKALHTHQYFKWSRWPIQTISTQELESNILSPDNRTLLNSTITSLSESSQSIAGHPIITDLIHKKGNKQYSILKSVVRPDCIVGKITPQKTSSYLDAHMIRTYRDGNIFRTLTIQLPIHNASSITDFYHYCRTRSPYFDLSYLPAITYNLTLWGDLDSMLKISSTIIEDLKGPDFDRINYGNIDSVLQTLINLLELLDCQALTDIGIVVSTKDLMKSLKQIITGIKNESIDNIKNLVLKMIYILNMLMRCLHVKLEMDMAAMNTYNDDMYTTIGETLYILGEMLTRTNVVVHLETSVYTTELVFINFFNISQNIFSEVQISPYDHIKDSDFSLNPFLIVAVHRTLLLGPVSKIQFPAVSPPLHIYSYSRENSRENILNQNSLIARFQYDIQFKISETQLINDSHNTNYSIDIRTDSTTLKIISSDCIFFRLDASDNFATLLTLNAGFGMNITASWSFDQSLVESVNVTNIKGLVTGNYTTNTVLLPQLTKVQRNKFSESYYRVLLAISPGQMLNSTNVKTDSIDVEISCQKIGCLNWNGLRREWENNHCQVKSTTSNNDVHCACEKGTAFSAGYTPCSMEQIYQKEIEIEEISIFDLMISPITSIFLALLISFLNIFYWAVNRQRQNVFKDKIYTLGFSPYHCDHYLIKLYNKKKVRSTPCLALVGDLGFGPIVHLQVRHEEMFKSKSKLQFITSVPFKLGNLRWIVWYPDPKGRDDINWFDGSIYVRHLNTGQESYFWQEDVADSALSNGKCLVLHAKSKCFSTGLFEHFWDSTHRFYVLGFLSPYYALVNQQYVKSSISMMLWLGITMNLVIISLPPPIKYLKDEINTNSPTEPGFFYKTLLASLSAFLGLLVNWINRSDKNEIFWYPPINISECLKTSDDNYSLMSHSRANGTTCLDIPDKDSILMGPLQANSKPGLEEPTLSKERNNSPDNNVSAVNNVPEAWWLRFLRIFLRLVIPDKDSVLIGPSQANSNPRLEEPSFTEEINNSLNNNVSAVNNVPEAWWLRFLRKCVRKSVNFYKTEKESRTVKVLKINHSAVKFCLLLTVLLVTFFNSFSHIIYYTEKERWAFLYMLLYEMVLGVMVFQLVIIANIALLSLALQRHTYTHVMADKLYHSLAGDLRFGLESVQQGVSISFRYLNISYSRQWKKWSNLFSTRKQRFFMKMNLNDFLLIGLYINIFIFVLRDSNQTKLIQKQTEYVKSIFGVESSYVTERTAMTAEQMWIGVEQDYLKLLALLKDNHQQDIAMSTVRLTQHRAKKSYCSSFDRRNFLNFCHENFMDYETEKKDFKEDWESPLPPFSKSNPGRYTYSEPDTSTHLPLLGGIDAPIKKYPSGGYTYLLEIDEQNLGGFKLLQNNWVDNKTRMISFEFDVYNPNIKLITSYITVYQFNGVGIFKSSRNIFSAKLGDTIEDITMFMVFNIFMIYLFVRILVNIRSMGFRAHFSTLRYCIEVIQILYWIVLLLLYYIRVSMKKEKFAQRGTPIEFKQQRNYFLEFRSLGSLEYYYDIVIVSSILIFNWRFFYVIKKIIPSTLDKILIESIHFSILPVCCALLYSLVGNTAFKYNNRNLMSTFYDSRHSSRYEKELLLHYGNQGMLFLVTCQLSDFFLFSLFRMAACQSHNVYNPKTVKANLLQFGKPLINKRGLLKKR